MELFAALKRPCAVRFVSDSQYLVKGMREWVAGWKARGWKRKAGPIENLDLWQRLDVAAARHQCAWEWVRGHAGHPRNEYANDLATAAARTQERIGRLRPSGFEEWLGLEREKGRYLDFFESLPPAPPERLAAPTTARPKTSAKAAITSLPRPRAGAWPSSRASDVTSRSAIPHGTIVRKRARSVETFSAKSV